MKQGKITPNGVVLRSHEMMTVVFLTSMGFNVELISKSNKPGIRTPDIKINGLYWEMKAPRGEGGSLMKNTLQKAVCQSENVVVDLRRVKRHQTKCMAELRKEFTKSRSLKRLKIISKTGKVLEMEK